ncbi:MAG: UTP--glucose-1-phosphate uridylyltransferase [Bdellovibrionales bacterium]|nr:UTP--glucose-1-phosphate uridylyltransferase [Bdellovibrionales bacterium]
MNNQQYISKAEACLPTGQEHILEHLGTISESAAKTLLGQITAIDWSSLDNLVTPPNVTEVSPPDIVSLNQRNELDCVERGIDAYQSGLVASLIVAGGQGSRLGYEGPKGCFVLPELNCSIFEIHFTNHKNLCEKYNCAMPLLIMTGPQNDAETKQFLSEHNYFGLDVDQVHFFSQASVPSIDESGRLVLASEDSLLLNPNGHGGCVDALIHSGVLDSIMKAGVKFINYIQVDNILSRLDDPFAIGLALERGLDAITKVVEKRDALERVGHLVKCEGKDQIVEYSSLSDTQKARTNEHGELLMRWANTAMHVWRAQFLRERGDSPLPYNRSAPKAATVNLQGHSEQVSVMKCERFIFDLLKFTDRAVGLEVLRVEEFAPVKNADGDDSPATAVALYKNVLKS